MRTARVLAVLGTTLTGIPIAAPVVLAAVSLLVAQHWRFDYLLPGELVVPAATGGAALLAASLVARRARVAVCCAANAAALFFVLVGVIANATGLATGAAPAEGPALIAVAAVYVGYVLSVVAMFAVGVVLCGSLFGRRV